jgi:hypothetical protein
VVNLVVNLVVVPQAKLLRVKFRLEVQRLHPLKLIIVEEFLVADLFLVVLPFLVADLVVTPFVEEVEEAEVVELVHPELTKLREDY